MAHLTIQTQGVKGGNTKIEHKGYVLIESENNKLPFRLSVDNFEGMGNTYKEREQPEIKVFIGSDYYVMTPNILRLILETSKIKTKNQPCNH